MTERKTNSEQSLQNNNEDDHLPGYEADIPQDLAEIKTNLAQVSIDSSVIIDNSPEKEPQNSTSGALANPSSQIINHNNGGPSWAESLETINYIQDEDDDFLNELVGIKQNRSSLEYAKKLAGHMEGFCEGNSSKESEQLLILGYCPQFVHAERQRVKLENRYKRLDLTEWPAEAQGYIETAEELAEGFKKNLRDYFKDNEKADTSEVHSACTSLLEELQISSKHLIQDNKHILEAIKDASTGVTVERSVVEDKAKIISEAKNFMSRSIKTREQLRAEKLLTWKEASEEIAKLLADKLFDAKIKKAAANNKGSEPYLIKKAQARADHIDEYCDNNSDNMSEQKIDQFKILGRYLLFVHHEQNLRKFHQRKEKGTFKQSDANPNDSQKHVIAFNHMLSNYMFKYPEATTTNAMFKELNGSAMLQADDKEVMDGDTQVALRGALKGARAEAIAQGVCRVAQKEYPNLKLEFRQGTVEEDMSGGDLFITLNGKEYMIDIKSSEDQASSADDNVEEKMSGKKPFVFCPFPSSMKELGGDDLCWFVNEEQQGAARAKFGREVITPIHEWITHNRKA